MGASPQTDNLFLGPPASRILEGAKRHLHFWNGSWHLNGILGTVLGNPWDTDINQAAGPLIMPKCSESCQEGRSHKN